MQNWQRSLINAGFYSAMRMAQRGVANYESNRLALHMQNAAIVKDRLEKGELFAFISYSSADEEEMNEVYESLTQGGIPCFAYQKSTSGQMDSRFESDWEKKLEILIKLTTCLVVIVTPNMRSDSWVREETKFAKIHDVPTLVLFTKGANEKHLTLGTVTCPSINLNSNKTRNLEKLTHDIRATLLRQINSGKTNVNLSKEEKEIIRQYCLEATAQQSAEVNKIVSQNSSPPLPEEKKSEFEIDVSRLTNLSPSDVSRYLMPNSQQPSLLPVSEEKNSEFEIDVSRLTNLSPSDVSRYLTPSSQQPPPLIGENRIDLGTTNSDQRLEPPLVSLPINQQLTSYKRESEDEQVELNSSTTHLWRKIAKGFSFLLLDFVIFAIFISTITIESSISWWQLMYFLSSVVIIPTYAICLIFSGVFEAFREWSSSFENLRGLERLVEFFLSIFRPFT